MSVVPYAACAVALMLVVGVYVHRLAAGPSVFDRLLGVSAFGTTTTLVLLLIGVVYERLDMFVDLSLAYRSANEQWVAELFLDNATDEEVKTEAFYGGNQTFYKWGDPRQAGIRVSFKYK